MLPFADRASAGEQLAAAIASELARCPQPQAAVVYALPRGGIATAVPVARAMGCPLSVVVAKKIALPPNEELALGAIASDGRYQWGSTDPEAAAEAGEALEAAKASAQQQAIEQWQALAPGCPEVTPAGKVAILVDDGIATGMTVAAAARSIRAQQPSQVWIAAPVAPPEVARDPPTDCDRAIVLATPQPFLSVGRFYQRFEQLDTDEALAALQQHNAPYLQASG